MRCERERGEDVSLISFFPNLWGGSKAVQAASMNDAADKKKACRRRGFMQVTGYSSSMLPTVIAQISAQAPNRLRSIRVSISYFMVALHWMSKRSVRGRYGKHRANAVMP